MSVGIIIFLELVEIEKNDRKRGIIFYGIFYKCLIVKTGKGIGITDSDMCELLSYALQESCGFEKGLELLDTALGHILVSERKYQLVLFAHFYLETKLPS